MIEVTVKFTDKDFKSLIKEAGCKITNPAEFTKLINSKKFQKALAADLKLCWEQTNEQEDAAEVVDCMGFSEVIAEDKGPLWVGFSQ